MTGKSIRAGQPLENKRIVVTRAPEQSTELKARLEELGAIVLSLPVVSFSPVSDTTALDDAIHSLADFNWVLFTSANAVRFFCERWRQLETQPHSMCSFAAVGSATARAMTENGIAVNLVAPEFRGLALARKLAPILQGKRVLLPRSDRARSDLPEALREAGAEVTDVVAYHTGASVAAPEAADALRNGRVDVVTFFSPSAVENLRDTLGSEMFASLAGTAAMAAVGPVTAAAIRDAGLPVAIEAGEATVDAVVAAIEKYFSLHKAPVARSV
jgi:uroporphyrinogen III methyltransferase / synthase